MLVLALLMFVGCGEDPVCTDTGVDMDTLIETGDTGTTGTTETGDTGMTATE